MGFEKNILCIGRVCGRATMAMIATSARVTSRVVDIDKDKIKAWNSTSLPSLSLSR